MMKFYSNIDMRGNHIKNCLDLANVIYQPNHDYQIDDLVVHKNKIYIATKIFTSSDVGLTIDDNFTIDLTSGNFIEFSNNSIEEYKQNTSYMKDTLVYHDDKIGRITTDFTSDNTASTIDDSFLIDVASGNILISRSTVETSITEDIQANVAIGAAPANFLYKEGMTFTEFVKKIAVKDMLASINFTITDAGLKKKGIVINGSNLKAVITNIGNISINDLEFYKNSTVLSTQSFIDGTMTYTESSTDAITTNTIFKVIVHHSNGQSVEKQASITFVNPSYFGIVNSLVPTSAEILALTEDLKDKKSKSYTHSINDARACYAYPTSFGDLTHIKDSNNFEYLNSFTKTVTTLNGESYNLYILTDPVTVSNFVWKFE